MLELVTIFLMTWLVALVAIWTYRKISALRGTGTTVDTKQKKPVTTNLRAHQGYVSLVKPSHRSVHTSRSRTRRSVRAPRATGTVKAPWGW